MLSKDELKDLSERIVQAKSMVKTEFPESHAFSKRYVLEVLELSEKLVKETTQ